MWTRRPRRSRPRPMPPWLVTMCLTIARPRPVPPVARERAGSTGRTARRRGRRSRLGDADALVGDRDLDAVGRASSSVLARGADRDPGAGAGCRRSRCRPGWPPRWPAGPRCRGPSARSAHRDDDLDPGLLGGQPGAVDGLVDHVDRRRPRRRPAAARRPARRDSSISSRDQPAEPGALVLHPAGEPARPPPGRRRRPAPPRPAGSARRPAS